MDNQKKETVKYTIMNTKEKRAVAYREDFLLACRRASLFASNEPGVTFEVWQDVLLYETSSSLPKDLTDNCQAPDVKGGEDVEVEYVVKDTKTDIVVGQSPSLKLAQIRARYLCSQDYNSAFRIFKETKTVVLLEEHQASTVSEALQEKREEWIPALVKFQTPPSWWRMVEEKSKLMGTVILVQKLEGAPDGFSKVPYHYRSVRKGKTEQSGWNWAKADIMLYPTASDIAFVKSQMILAKGFKV